MRVFVGLWPPSDIVEVLVETQQAVRRRLPGGLLRWIAPDQVHVTLRFLGEVADARMDDLVRELRSAVSASTAFQLSLNGLGVFPATERPRVLWAGLKGDLPALGSLQQGVRRASEGFTVHSDDKPFHPHLTLARVGETRHHERREIAAAMERVAPQLRASWVAGDVRLVRSELHASGPVYSTLVGIPLLVTR